jgi:hypothetical protein
MEKLNPYTHKTNDTIKGETMTHLYIRIPKPSMYDNKIRVQIMTKTTYLSIYADKVTVIDDRKKR